MDFISKRCETILASGFRCSRKTTWVVTIRIAGERIDEGRCGWHRREGMNARKVEVAR